MARIISLSCALALSCAAIVANGADVAAGKAKVQQACSECHDPGDPPWKGRSEKDMQDKIAAVVAGQAKHPKKLQLTDAEIANIAAYIGSGAP